MGAKDNRRLVLDAVWTVITAAIYILMALVLAAGIVFAASGGEMSLFGVQFRIVASGSMEGETEFYAGKEYEVGRLNTGTLVFIREKPKDAAKKAEWYSELEAGDVITFLYDWPDMGVIPLTHRIIATEREPDGQYKYTIQGDSPYCTGEYQTVYSGTDAVLGKVVGCSDVLGAVLRFLQSGWGAGMLVALSACILANGVRQSLRPETPEERMARLGRK